MRKKRTVWGMILVVGMAAFLLGEWVLARSRNRDKDGFPDYNRIEYAKPLPPVDQQVPEVKPGSIQLRVGTELKAPRTPLESIQVPLNRSSRDTNESEPPLEAMLDSYSVVHSTPTSATVSTTTFTSTAPVTP